MTIKSIALALLAFFALGIVACGDDDNGTDNGNGSGFELPPASDYKFNDFTGTMEVEFPAEGASAVAVGQPPAETGNVSGSLTALLEGNVLTIQFLSLGVTFGDTTVAFTGIGQDIEGTSESTGTVGPDGTTLELHTEATTGDGETATSDGPLQLETDDLFPGPPLNLAPPDGWGPLPFVDGNGNEVFIVNDFALELTLTGGPSDDVSDDLNGDGDGDGSSVPGATPPGPGTPTGALDPDEALETFVADRYPGRDYIGECPQDQVGEGTPLPIGVCATELYRSETLVTFSVGVLQSDEGGEAIIVPSEDGSWSVNYILTAIGERMSLGSGAVVFHAGDCLNFRDTPSTSGAVQSCQIDGTTGELVDGPVEADGITWWQLEGLGWASGQYLQPCCMPKDENK